MGGMEPIIQFIGYYVQKLFIEKKENWNNDGDSVQLIPNLVQKIEKIDEKNYDLTLQIVICQENMPFDMDVAIKGSFIIENTDNPDVAMRINASAILYPYLRSTVTMATTLAGLPPMILPTINVASVFAEKDEK